jgi:hypothetical protein
MEDWYRGEFQEGAAGKDGGNLVAGGGCVLVVDAKDAGIKNLVRHPLTDGKAFAHTLLSPTTRNSNSCPT